MNMRGRSRGKFHKLLHLTRDVTGEHHRPVLSDAYLPRLARGEAAETQDMVSDASERKVILV